MSGGTTLADSAGSETSRVAALRDFALAQPLRRVAAVLFGGIAIMAVLGTLQRLGAAPNLFDVDGEGKPPAAWSAIVLLVAATAAWLVSTVPSEHDARLRFRLLAAFLAFMGADEGLTLHERLSDAVGVGWLILYLPVAAVGGVMWLAVLRRLWPLERERILMILGAAAWLGSQLIEKVQSNGQEGRIEGYGALSLIEEILEVTGSALFALALLGALQVLYRRRPSRLT